MKKRDCPYCDKKEINGRHIRMCPKRPQEGQETPLGEESEGLPAKKVITPKAPKSGGKLCHQCGKQPVQKLNALDWRCPDCGDYEIRKV